MVGTQSTHLAFTIRRSEIEDRILIPKYYDPDLVAAQQMAMPEFDLPALTEVLLPGESGSRLGRYVPREFYGTGDIPFVRTSDLADWRVRPDFKKGVSQEVYEEFGQRSDIQVKDLLMVAHGTYLVGATALVTQDDVPMLLQDHLFRLRVDESSGLATELVLAALSTAFVQRQVRARQFSAEIIDKIGERHHGLRLPIPKDSSVVTQVVNGVRDIVSRQTKALIGIRQVSASSMRITRERAEAHYGFSVQRSKIKRKILIPKYYDPNIEELVAEAERIDQASWVSIVDLMKSGSLQLTTGVEVGKMAYGTGMVPFIRTSDMVAWEVKRDTKQGVSTEVYEEHAGKAALQPHDILLVRDGTYLVGNTAIVMPGDIPALFSGGLYRIRVNDTEQLDPFALIAALNHPLVRRQMRSKQFTRDVIDTLGNRLPEVRVPTAHLSNRSELARKCEASNSQGMS